MELQGPGFKLRGWKKEDAANIQRHANNINVSGYLLDRFPHPYTMESAESWVTYMLNLEPNYNFVIEIDGNVAGCIGLEFRHDVYRKSPLIGYWLGEAAWGRGIMTQAVMLVSNWAFVNLDINRLQAGVFSNNPRSMRVLEKAGFVKEGILKSSILKNGIVLDEHMYGLVRPR